ncbi:MAG: hypothetical protein V4520_15130 [Bacteroidota bacterium]
MKIKYALISAATFFLAISLSAFADGDWFSALLTNLNKWREDYPQEKVHLHFDKPFYSIGDDIWFKAYLVNTENHELSALSKVLYVDLVDERDSVHQTVVVPMENGLGNGDFKLTDSLVTTGNYHINAYTRWMQNFDPDFIFSKRILIGDARASTSIVASANFDFNEPAKFNTKLKYFNLADKSPVANKPITYNLLYKNNTVYTGKGVTDEMGITTVSAPIKKGYAKNDLYLQTELFISKNLNIKRDFAVIDSSEKIDFQIFPEGGRMVNGLRSRVAFKATRAGGNGINVKGYITDQNNNHIIDFATEHAGMGSFAFQPVAGNRYTAVINNPYGTENKYPLPKPDSLGYLFAVNHVGNDSVTIRVTASPSLSNSQEIGLVAQQNGVVKYAALVKMDQPVMVTKLPEARFNTGIVQFTLLSSTGNPLSERLVFVNRNDQLKINITGNKPTYNKREKVSLTLNTLADQAFLQSSLSVAVTADDGVKENDDDGNGILANLLLTSDLKGYIEQPNYYFNETYKDRAKHLDLLLLTQGWRRFNWTDIKDNKFNTLKYQPQKALTITGSIFNLKNKPVPGGKVVLLGSTTNGPIIIDTTADENGRFVFDNLDFNNDVKFVVRAKNTNNKDNIIIQLDKQTKPSVNFKLGERFSTVEFIDYLQNTQKRFDQLDNVPGKTIMLKQVDINGINTSKNAPQTIEGSAKIGSGQADIILKEDRFKPGTTMLQAFYGLPGVIVKKGGIYRIGRTLRLSNPEGEPMTILLDGSQIDLDMLDKLPPTDVAGVEILTSGYNTAIYGSQGYWGVILITTKKGPSRRPVEPKSYLDKITLAGYNVQREFYSPVYDAPNNSNKAGLRSTIYWQPNLITNEKGEAEISFYTADNAGTYNIVAEGLNTQGKLARKTFKIIVNK